MSLRVILTTGGTGGHIFPALAVAQALKDQLPDVEILFVGGVYGPEGNLAQKAGLPFHGLPVRGMVGRKGKALLAALSMIRGIGQAWRLVHQWKPDVVMGFGGYAAFATVVAGWMHGRPTGIHEQNAIPGMANKLLTKVTRRVCLSWPDAANSFPAAKSVLTGNPIRKEITDLATLQSASSRLQNKPALLVMGGSQGARAINSLVISILSVLRDGGVRILHQTGPKDVDRVREAYKSHGFSHEDVEDMVVPFIEHMDKAYAWCDLALCRAGATTLAELAASATPSVLIPFPYATHDHQTGNARAMEQAGGGMLVPEGELERRDMGALILSILQDSHTLESMSRGAQTLARPDAAAAVAAEAVRLATNKKS